MERTGQVASSHGLEECGIRNVAAAHWNLTGARLVEEAIRRGEAMMAAHGPLVVRTGAHTGRSPRDRFIVSEPSSKERIWWGKTNVAIEEEKFDSLLHRLQAFYQNREVFVQDLYVGADPKYRRRVRVITEQAWHSLFARNMFIRPARSELTDFVPDFTVIQAPSFRADPALDGTRSEVFVELHFGRGLVIIGGTAYAGEIKKSVFTTMNYLLPIDGVLAMHSSANVGDEEKSAVFFGLSGTGKTTLSADPERTLIGDDEHGWSDEGVFNFEGGCYAKMIKLSPEGEPEIYATTRMFGTVLENVVIDPDSRTLDLDDESITENTRGAYPISHIPNASESGAASHPSDIVMLTCDAFGVLPPIARLTPEQAMYQFMLGYTAKVAGTEMGVTEPEATFSTCFGAPFMPLHPSVYAKLLGEKIARHNARVWLVNTGWTGGPYGEGSRMKLSWTRSMLHGALDGKLDDVAYETDPVFGLAIPKECPGVPPEVLMPRNTWKDTAAYDSKARELAGRFRENFAQFEEHVSAAVRDAGPAV